MDKLTTRDFLQPFCDIWSSKDRRICFVLGAGASKTSNIKTGSELAKDWLEEIQQSRRADYDALLANKGVDPKNPGAHYSEIYHERFRHDTDSGFERINKEMERARPKYGYSVLAQILAKKHHNIIITTNFDNLTEEALYTYTDSRPLICGHESLAVFAQPSVNRPLIIKIHRDRFLDPQSQPEEIDRMDEAWKNALNGIFTSNLIPVFIGYGGNDGSLMGYLEAIPRFKNIFWCEWKGAEVSDRVEKLLEKHNGKLVKIDGFDELMFMLQDVLKLPLLIDDFKTVAQARAKEYQKTVEAIRKGQEASGDEESRKAVERLVDKAGDSWWSWELRAEAAKTAGKKTAIYQ